MSALQPDTRNVDRSTTAPFLLRLFWRPSRPLEAYEFSVAPPSDTTGVSDYSSLLPSTIRQQSVQIYTWPTCTLAELTGLLTSVLPPNVLPSPAVGTRLVYKLIFPDTRAEVREGGKGKWIDKPLGTVVIGGQDADLNTDGDATNGDAVIKPEDLEGDAQKTLLDARFVIGDYVACTIYTPGPDGRIASLPPPRPPRDSYAGARGPPPMRENGGGYGRGGGGRGGYGGGYGGRGGGYAAGPPVDEWRRGERPPGGAPERGGWGGRGGGGGYGGGRGGGGRPY